MREFGEKIDLQWRRNTGYFSPMAFVFMSSMPRCDFHRRTVLLGLFLHVGLALGMPEPSGPGGPRASVAKLDPKLDPKLDQKAVHDEYVNGNFETVIESITAFQKGNPRHSREDSIFIARHLAVVHAANPKSVEAGKHWMHRLILLSPAADLSGMYVSEEIDRLFEKVRQEAGIRPGNRGSRTWLWLGAGGTALAVAVAAWLILDGESDAPSRTVTDVDP